MSQPAPMDARVRTQALSAARALPLLMLVAGASLLPGCGGPGDPDLPDQTYLHLPNEKPGGGLFNGGSYLVDEHGGGVGQELYVQEMFWGRLADIFDIDPESGARRLVYPGLVIGQEVRNEPGRWEYATNPVTGVVELTVFKENTEEREDAFDNEVIALQANLVPVEAKGTDPGETPPFSLVARNAALVLRFSDLVDPDSISLNDSVRMLVGAPPTDPFEGRLVLDQNHGGIAANSDEFHSTRLIVDFTVSEAEAAQSTVPIAANGLGLPASNLSLDSTAPVGNVAIRIPTRSVPAIGQFNLVTNLKGSPVSDVNNGPVDVSSLSNDVVRVFRSGNSSDINNGFLQDLEPPQLVASQIVSITSAANAPGGEPGYDFVIDLSFAIPQCGFNPVPGDLVLAGDELGLEVNQLGTTSGGISSGLRVRLPLANEPRDPQELVGAGTFKTVLRQEIANAFAPCFVRFSPSPLSGATDGVSPDAQVIIEFSEPMDPSSGRAFDSFQLTTFSLPTQPWEWIVGDVRSTPSLTEMLFRPSIPLPNYGNGSESIVISVASDVPGGGLRDLAGNALEVDLPQVTFTVNPAASLNTSQNFALRFSSPDEVLVDNAPGNDWQGQFTYDLSKGEIRPRALTRFSAVIDDVASPMVAQMQQLPTGLQTPLSNLGSKLHTMWRYPDMGFTISNFEYDNTNLDVEGVAMAPQAGSVVPTFYPQFEMLLGHSDRMPDEFQNIDSALPQFPFSGLKTNDSFADHYLNSSTSPDFVVVHDRPEGFEISNLDTFGAPNTETTMLYMPMNRGKQIADHRYFTFRDTSVLERGAYKGNATNESDPEFGVPLVQETSVLGIIAPVDQPGSSVPPIDNSGIGMDHSDVGWAWGNTGGATTGNGSLAGDARPPGIPTVGLPLLLEYRCYPSEALSLNNLRASIAITSSPRPFFRAFSTGGFNQDGIEVVKDPDNQPSPTGGFNGNPANPPIGKPTPALDPTVYFGQVDFLVRVSRAYSQTFAPDSFLGFEKDYVAAVFEPRAEFQPAGTSVELAIRGTAANRPSAGSPEIDVENLDLYGDRLEYLDGGDEPPAPSKRPWSTSVDSIDGDRGFQFRLTFVSNPVSGLSPTLSSIGLAMRSL